MPNVKENFNSNIKYFFNIYSRFMASDLYSSMRPITGVKKNTNEEIEYYIGGRQEFLILKFVQTFKTILFPLNNQIQEETKKALDNFDKLIDAYIEDNKLKINMKELNKAVVVDTSKIHTNTIDLVFNKENINMFKLLYSSISTLSKYTSKYNAIKGNNKQYKSMKIILTQSNIEFSNALSHLVYVLKYDNNENNIAKAFTHIHRATLDNYKAMIKNLKIPSSKTNDLIQLRINEFNSMGKSILFDKENKTYNTKQELITGYKDLVLDLVL